MSIADKEIITVLVIDDERPILDAYREVFEGSSDVHAPVSEVGRLRAKLFANTEIAPYSAFPAFEVRCVEGAEAGVQAVREMADNQQPLDVIFLDLRMPPGPDGIWAASQIRAINPNIDIVVTTAFSDVDPRTLSARIPPADKLFYLQKPFHAYEVRQLAVALGRKARAEAKNLQLAYYDSLTGLPNRELCRTRLSQAIALAKRHARQLALFFIDLDNFKRINDTLGHSLGDELLRSTAERLVQELRTSDALMRVSVHELSRLGGDEFVVLLSEIKAPEDAGFVAGRILSALEAPICIGGHELVVTLSIGIAVYPRDGADVETLFKNADLAMYFAKRSGRNKFQYFSESMNASALKRLTIENQLHGAMERGEFSLNYQPQLDLVSGEISGMEALIRWENRELGVLPPQDFIPVAEDTGLIVPIGDWVLRHACAQAKAWRDAGVPLQRIAVNVSAIQFLQPDFPKRVGQALEQVGLEPAVLELELTEGVVINDLDNAIKRLGQLKALNIQIAIDDFGTGYSSMSYLKHLPVDRLKIDRSFIRHINSNANDRAIATAIIALAQSMNLRVTAEGVEEEGQLTFMETLRCDEVQGYYISRPLSAEAAESYLRGRAKRIGSVSALPCNSETSCSLAAAP